jgi:DNA-binding NtrC family response regulator
MKPQLRLLMLEDTPTDAELVTRELGASQWEFEVRRVETREDFVRALSEFGPDVILADYRLPAFDGMTALAIARVERPDVPFIFVTGAMGEQVAIDMLQQGATDYVLKDKLAKLVPAVERALKESEARIKRRQAEEALRERVEELETLNRLMVGRELKMVELKKENERLRQLLAAQAQPDAGVEKRD